MNLRLQFKFFKKRPLRKRLIIITMTLAVLIGIFAFTQISRQQPLEYTEVKRADIISTISASGTLAGKSVVNLHFGTSGKLASVNIQTGDSVVVGQTLASLDATEQAITLQQAKNNLADKQTALDKILDDIHLFQYGNGGFSNVGTANETMTQRAQRIAAESAKNNAFDAVKSAEQAFSDTFITSPISGIVTKSDFFVGQVVSPADIITQVIDINALYFDAEVDESDISKISLGQKAKVALNAYSDKQLSGTVAQIKPTTKTATSGATVIVVRIKLENPDIIFISDLNGQAEIEVETAEKVLTIPAEALVDEKYVYIQTDKGVEEREIIIGISSENEIEIKEGLFENEKVITNPASRLNK